MPSEKALERARAILGINCEGGFDLRFVDETPACAAAIAESSNAEVLEALAVSDWRDCEIECARLLVAAREEMGR